MAWPTQADLDALDAAIAARIAGGMVRSVTFSDRVATFDSIDDMLKLRAVMAQALNAAAGTSSTRFAATSKGV